MFVSAFSRNLFSFSISFHLWKIIWFSQQFLQRLIFILCHECPQFTIQFEIVLSLFSYLWLLSLLLIKSNFSSFFMRSLLSHMSSFKFLLWFFKFFMIDSSKFDSSSELVIAKLRPKPQPQLGAELALISIQPSHPPTGQVRRSLNLIQTRKQKLLNYMSKHQKHLKT